MERRVVDVLFGNDTIRYEGGTLGSPSFRRGRRLLPERNGAHIKKT
jgi:hypothetical protein